MPRKRKGPVGGVRKGAGRPPALPGEKRSKGVTVWMTVDQHADRVAAAEREGLPLSDWMLSASELALARGSTR